MTYVDELAQSFHSLVRAQVPNRLEVIDLVNIGRLAADDGTCETSRHCDAAGLMCSAFVRCYGRRFDPNSDADFVRCDAAWRTAAAVGFSARWPQTDRHILFTNLDSLRYVN